MHWPPALVEVLFLHDDPPSGGARNVAFSTQFFFAQLSCPIINDGYGSKNPRFVLCIGHEKMGYTMKEFSKFRFYQFFGESKIF